MVIHNPEQEQKWLQISPPQAKTEPLSKSPRRFSVLAVQCLACALIVVVVLLFRVAGGSAYTQLQRKFSDAMAGNELMAVIMRWWDDDPVDLATKEGVKDESFTPSAP